MNRSSIASLTISCLLGLNTSCSSPERYYPVTDIAPRQNSHGFSISPPHGEGWYEKHKGDSLLYLKKTGSSDHLVYMKATEISINPNLYSDIGFGEYVRIMKKSDLPEDRYENIIFTIEPYTSISPYCVRYLRTYKDYGDNRDKNSVYVNVENGGMVCMHPDNPEFGIDMYYSGRSKATSDLISYRKEGDTFLNSLHFDSARQAR